MQLPEALRNAIQGELEGVNPRSLAQASAEITTAYKAGDFSRPPLRSTLHRLAYTLVRMPATFAAVTHALHRLAVTVPALAPCSMLDIGSGPGTAAWAAAEMFPTLKDLTLLERVDSLISLGKRLGASHSLLKTADWRLQNVAAEMEIPHSDLVVFSYSLGELGRDPAQRLISRAWAATRQALVIVEPGTRRGFDVVLRAREQFIGSNIQLAAPCPHMQHCPMAASGDWCHFAQRVERTSEHRRLKDGSLGYEDEKFSYVAASKLPVVLPRARIVRHPQNFSGYVKLQLCSGPVLEQATVTRSHKPAYKEARHARWGDQWNH